MKITEPGFIWQHIFHTRNNGSLTKMIMSQTCGSRPEAPRRSAACSSPDKTSECSHCEGSEFISECTPSLKAVSFWMFCSVRILAQSQMEWVKRLLKHTEPPHRQHVCCRGGWLWYGLVSVSLTDMLYSFFFFKSMIKHRSVSLQENTVL